MVVNGSSYAIGNRPNRFTNLRLLQSQSSIRTFWREAFLFTNIPGKVPGKDFRIMPHVERSFGLTDLFGTRPGYDPECCPRNTPPGSYWASAVVNYRRRPFGPMMQCETRVCFEITEAPPQEQNIVCDNLDSLPRMLPHDCFAPTIGNRPLFDSWNLVEQVGNEVKMSDVRDRVFNESEYAIAKRPDKFTNLRLLQPESNEQYTTAVEFYTDIPGVAPGKDFRRMPHIERSKGTLDLFGTRAAYDRDCCPKNTRPGRYWARAIANYTGPDGIARQCETRICFRLIAAP